MDDAVAVPLKAGADAAFRFGIQAAATLFRSARPRREGIGVHHDLTLQVVVHLGNARFSFSKVLLPPL